MSSISSIELGSSKYVTPSSSRQQSADSTTPDASEVASKHPSDNDEFNLLGTPSTSTQVDYDLDFIIPDTPSTSTQAGYDLDFIIPDTPSTSEPVVRAPLSSIECDPDNPSPETPPSEDKPVVGSEEVVALCKRFRIQKPQWKKHIKTFKKVIIKASIIAVLALLFFIVACALSETKKIILLSISFLIGLASFLTAFFLTEEGPPLLSSKDGKEKPAAYESKVIEDHDLPRSFLNCFRCCK